MLFAVVVLPIVLLTMVVAAVPVASIPYIPPPTKEDVPCSLMPPIVLLAIFTTAGCAAVVVIPLIPMKPLLLITLVIKPLPVPLPIVLPVISALPLDISIPYNCPVVEVPSMVKFLSTLPCTKLGVTLPMLSDMALKDADALVVNT
jgi:hypothetical protein